MELDPPLSGAYIRSLVKQLTTTTSTTTSKPRGTIMNTNDLGCVVVDTRVSPQSRNLRKHGKVLGPQQQHHPNKKQVRRRLHTSRPYQERLLNMAEARKEIVTALKFHRANMKQAIENQQQLQHQPQEQNHQQQQQQQQHNNPRTYPSSCMNNFPNDSSPFSYIPPPITNSNTFSVSASSPSISSPTLLAQNPNFTLPNQALGLSINFHDFNNLDATLLLNNNNNNTPLFSYSSPTISSSPPLSVVTTDQEVPSSINGTSSSSHAERVSSSNSMHTAMDDEGMEEMRTLGEKHQMEWNDTVNLMTSAWWFKFLENMEQHGGGAGAPKDEVKAAEDGGDASNHGFDGVMEFPAWLNNANESCLEQCSEDSFKDPTLPCMDVGDIEFEGMDEEWLA